MDEMSLVNALVIKQYFSSGTKPMSDYERSLVRKAEDAINKRAEEIIKVS